MNKQNLQPSLGNRHKSPKKVQRLTDELDSNNSDTRIPQPIKTLKCCMCKNFKPVSDYYKAKNLSRGYQYRCIDCSKRRSCEYMYENREVIHEKWKIKRENLTLEQKKDIADKNLVWRRKDVRKILLSRAKYRSRQLGLQCNLTVDDIIITERCPLLDVPFKYGSTHDKWFTHSLDRIDNTKGYIKGNVHVITYLANTMKSQADIPQLTTFAKNILKLLKADDIV